MIRKIIIALIIVCVVCFVTIGGFIAFQKYFFPQFLRTKTVEVLSQCVKGEVAVSEVDFGLFSGLTVKELTIGDPVFGNKQPILHVPSISIKLDIASVFSGKVRVKGITIASPEIFVTRTAEGQWNIREFIRPDFKWPFTPVEGALKDGIVIEDVKIDYQDATMRDVTYEPIVDAQFFLAPSPQSIKVFYLSASIEDNFWGNYGLSGTLNLEKAKFSLSVSAKNFNLRKELFEKFASAGKKIWDELAPTGKVNLSCNIEYDRHAEKKLSYNVIADLKEGSFVLEELPLPVSNVFGVLEMSNGCIYLKNIKGTVGSGDDIATVSFNGRICTDERGGIVTAEVSDMIGTEEIVRMIPTVGERIWTEFEPTGRVNVYATLIVKNGEVKTDNVTLDLRDVDVTYTHFPLPAHGITGEVEISKGKLFTKTVHGYVGNGTTTPFDLQGQISLSGGDSAIEINISNMNVTDKVVKMIPHNGQSVWTDYEPTGRCDASITYTVSGDKTNYDAIIDLRNMDLRGEQLMLPITGVSGKLEYSGDNLYFRNVDGYMINGMLTKNNKLEKAHFTLKGSVNINEPSGLLTFKTTNLLLDEPVVRHIPSVGDKLWEGYRPRGRVDVGVDYQINGGDDKPAFFAEINCKALEILCAKLTVPISKLTGFIETDGTTLRTRGLRGMSCKGKISTELEADLGASPIKYKLNLEFLEADVSEFMRVALKSDKQLSGLISGKCTLYSNSDDTETLRGKGEIKLSEGNLFDTPVILSLFKVLNLSLPEKDVFHTADIKYTIENDVVHIERAKLTSDSVEIAGTGDVGLDGKLDMVAIVEFKGNTFLSGIPIVGEVKDFIVGGIVRRLTKFELKGTIKEPETKPVSLKALKRPSVKNVFELLKGE